MSINFYAGCYFPHQIERETQFAELFDICKALGFDYLSSPRYESCFKDQLVKIAARKTNNFWITGYEGNILVSIGDQPKEFDFPVHSNINLSFFLFDQHFISSINSEQNPLFLEKFLELQIRFYLQFKSCIGWAGYDPTVPHYDEFQTGELKALHWFNILGPHFVEKIGREKILNAPAWQIQELPEGSVVVRLSQHPDEYEKIEGVYIHEFLGLKVAR
jgi:hypothetical protein